jgi:hypothetical protein
MGNEQHYAWMKKIAMVRVFLLIYSTSFTVFLQLLTVDLYARLATGSIQTEVTLKHGENSTAIHIFQHFESKVSCLAGLTAILCGGTSKVSFLI